MTERGILFSAPMVLALIAGTKTQTRRIASHRRCNYGVIGDRLWVRETWAVDESLDAVSPSDLSRDVDLLYVADGHRVKPHRSFDRGKTRVSIHMPRWASRILLEIVDVRFERVQSISEEDARAEGLVEWTSASGVKHYGIGIPDVWETDPRKAYARLWTAINGPDSWAANPWVWALTFRRIPT